jgi:hypothetical protein
VEKIKKNKWMPRADEQWHLEVDVGKNGKKVVDCVHLSY